MSIDKQYKDKLYRGYTTSPKLLLSREVYRLFHDVDSDGYVYFMQNFVEDVGVLVGRNMPALCDKIADQILRHMEPNEPDDTKRRAGGEGSA
jgi:hypothetical protein